MESFKSLIEAVKSFEGEAEGDHYIELLDGNDNVITVIVNSSNNDVDLLLSDNNISAFTTKKELKKFIAKINKYL